MKTYMITSIVLIILYFFIGGFINAMNTNEDEEIEFAPIFLWPFVIILWSGDEFGRLIKKRFNK